MINFLTVPVVLIFGFSEFLHNIIKQEGLAVSSIARDLVVEMTPPSSAIAPMHFRHRQTDRQTDTDIVA